MRHFQFGIFLCGCLTSAYLGSADSIYNVSSYTFDEHRARMYEMMDIMEAWWNRATGLWTGAGWWNSGNIVNAVADFTRLTGDSKYMYMVNGAYAKNNKRYYGGFRNEYLDDTEWWACAFVRAYDATGDDKYLKTAQAQFDFIWATWQNNCEGGVLWNEHSQYINAVANEGFLKLAAMLANRLPGNDTFLKAATKTLTWFKKTGMVLSNNLIVDGMIVAEDGTCSPPKPGSGGSWNIWSYNQGSILGALCELYDATDDTSYLEQAKTLADASTTYGGLHNQGVLRDKICEDHQGQGGDCAYDGQTFKGIYIRNVGELDRKLFEVEGKRRYIDYLKHQSNMIWETAQDPFFGGVGVHWDGYNPFSFVESISHAAALEAFIAAYEPELARNAAWRSVGVTMMLIAAVGMLVF